MRKKPSVYLSDSTCRQLLQGDIPILTPGRSLTNSAGARITASFKFRKSAISIGEKSADDEQTAKLFEPGATPIKERVGALERIHSLGIKTFAFIGPLLPGNPEKLIKDLKGKVDTVFIDRMNYVSSIKGFYRQVSLHKETADRFFHEYKERLISELKKREMKFEVLF